MKRLGDIGMMGKRARRTGSRMFCTAFIIWMAGHLSFLPALAAPENAKTVRVGYYEGDADFQDGFSDEERKSGYAYEYYQEIAALTGWRYEYIYGSREDVLEKLLADEVDIVAGIYQTDKRLEQMLFSKNDMGLDGEARYFAVNAKRPELLEELNYAQDKILAASPDFAVMLRQKYYGQGSRRQVLVLTEQEEEWLKQAGSLKIGYVRGNLPLSDRTEDGLPTGVAGELIALVSDYLKIPVEGVCYDNIVLMEDGLLAGEIDAAFPIYSDLWLSEKKGFFQTNALISDRAMVVYQGDYRSDLMDKVAISETGVGQRYYISAYYPEAETIYYETKKESLEAIRKKEVNCMIGCSSIIQRLLAEHSEYQDLHVAYLDTSEDFGIAVNADKSRLTEILNKVIRQIDDATLTDAMIRYSNVTPTYTLKDFIRRYSVALIAFLCFIFAILLYQFIGYRHRTALFNAEQAKTRAALEDALTAANVANEAKTTFLSSMSHDIRTPMNGIIGMTSIAAAHINDPAKVEDCLSKIMTSGKHLLALINEVLDMSKIESGEVYLNEEVLNLLVLMDDMITLNKPQSDARGHEMVVDIADLTHKEVIGDGLRIQQVFTNLVSNAVKYTPPGGKIEIALSEKPSDNPKLGCFEFVVADNGIGMSEEYLPYIFEAFSRARDEKTAEIQGTGLGMAITHNIVHMMNGDIQVESTLGEGSKFTVTLFLKLQDTESAAGSTAPDSTAGLKELTAQADFSGKRALMAEDNDINAEIAIEILGMMGLIVEWAHNGKEAVDMMEASVQDYYDCIFMDVQMPVMNGIEAAKAIRGLTRPDAESIPIFAMTANAFAEDVQAVRNAGMNEHIAKPLNVDTMLKILNQYLG